MDGILIVNKIKGYTSHDIVYQVKKIVNEKVGHTGTLDPMAEGVLPLLIGKGTLCSKYLINHDKIYHVTLKLGIKTETADGEGSIIEKQEVTRKLEKNEIQKTLDTFLGKQEQIPPIYSAIKVKGKKLYEYARKGETVEIKPRTIEIYKIQLQKVNKKEKELEFIVHCGKGTYMRSLCEDIATRLETIGYMKQLKRLQVGDFKIEDSVLLDEIKEQKKEGVQSKIITMNKIFAKYPKIELQNQKLIHFLNGVKITEKRENGIYQVFCEQKLIGTGEIKDNHLKRDIIL